MKILLIALLLLSDTTALVDASKNAKEKRKKSSTKVITNADVKKSKGKLAEKPATTSTAEPAPAESLTEKHEADRKKRLETDAAKAVLDKQVADLEAKLAAVEQSYYEENDLNRRDTEIVRRFAHVKKQLEAARAAREALGK